MTQFEKEELEQPSPMKEVDGGIVYLSREMGIPRAFGAPVLSPEVILDIPWTYKVDIWNVGCMIWDAFQGEHLFTGHDPEHNTYRGRAHLSEIIALLGPPPPSLLAQANLRSKFFSDEGKFSAGIPLPDPYPLERRETTLQGEANNEDRALFLQFMRKML
ncbi:hypothetical protein KC354_g2620 [Hortaea werneckii]|nr:hypothetical protein KC354_g2620 [Hortaea werneckii]